VQLVGEGRLGLDVLIAEVVDLTGTTISPAVTVGQLLTHTSGIADDPDEEGRRGLRSAVADKPCYSVIHTRDWLPQFAHSRRRSRPSDQWSCTVMHCSCGPGAD
jgi:CubicO group peptidase (beta-lactamase class C family)